MPAHDRGWGRSCEGIGVSQWLSDKESACNAREGDAGLIHASGRSPGDGTAVCSSILVWKTPWTKELGGYSPWGCKESDKTHTHTHTHTHTLLYVYPHRELRGGARWKQTTQE